MVKQLYFQVSVRWPKVGFEFHGLASVEDALLDVHRGIYFESYAGYLPFDSAYSLEMM